MNTLLGNRAKSDQVDALLNLVGPGKLPPPMAVFARGATMAVGGAVVGNHPGPASSRTARGKGCNAWTGVAGGALLGGGARVGGGRDGGLGRPRRSPRGPSSASAHWSVSGQTSISLVLVLMSLLEGSESNDGPWVPRTMLRGRCQEEVKTYP